MPTRRNKLYLIFYTIIVFIQSSIVYFVIASVKKNSLSFSSKDFFLLVEGLLFINLILITYLFPRANKQIWWNLIKERKCKKLLFLALSLLLLILSIGYLILDSENTTAMIFTVPLIYLFISYFISKKDFKHLKSETPSIKKKLVLQDLLAGILVIIFTLLCLYQLGKFMSVDEPKWIKDRIPQYAESWIKPNVSLSLINDKPGITPSLLAGTIVNTEFLRSDYFKASVPEMETLLINTRTPIIIFISLSLYLLYMIVKDIYNANFALFFLGSIVLSPPLIGISRIINPDSTLWIMLTLFFFSILAAKKTEKESYFLAAGIFYGLALLSKFTAIPYLMLPLLYIFFSNLKNKRRFYNDIAGFLFTLTIAFLTYSLFNPSVLLSFNRLFKLTFFIKVQQTPSIFLFIGFLLLVLALEFNIKNLLQQLHQIKYSKLIFGLLLLLSFVLISLIILDFYPNSIFNLNTYLNQISIQGSLPERILQSFSLQVFTNSSSIILIIIASPFLYLFRGKHTPQNNYELLSILSYIFIFLIFSVVFTTITIPIRYQIHLYPLVLFLATYLLIYNTRKRTLNIFIITFLILISISEIKHVSPYYLNFQNLLKQEVSPYLTESWGFGGYEIAEYIQENLPRDQKIWSDREGVCEFVDNDCEKRKGNPFAESSPYDYLVLTDSGYKLMIKETQEGENNDLLLLWQNYYNSKEPAYETYVNDNQSLHFKILKIDENDKRY